MNMNGPWREWSEEQQVGAVANIDIKALADSGDARVAALVRPCVRTRKSHRRAFTRRHG